MTRRVETSEIYEDLRAKLTTAHFTPGIKLKPSELQAQYGRSANTVREVLALGREAKVIAPEMLRLAVQNEVSRLAESYSD